MEGIVLLGVTLCIYFAPWLFAIVRRKTGRTKVFLVNLAFGWTIIGWFIALGMAFRSDTGAAKKAEDADRISSPSPRPRMRVVNIKSQFIPDASERRAAVSREARKLLDENPLIFDTETTGLDSRAEIVEICVVSVDRSVLLDTLVRPTKPIPADATNVHGIRDKDVRNAPDWREVYRDFESLLKADGAGNKVLTSYNREYDVRLAQQSSVAAGINMRRLPIRASAAKPSCIMELYAIWHGEWSGYHGSYKWKSLDVALKSFGLRFEGKAHRARSDTLGALDILKAMASY